MYIFDGRNFAKEKEKALKRRVRALSYAPKIAAILVGENQASKIYLSLKKKAAEEVGISLQLIKLGSASQAKLIQLIKELNSNLDVYGIMVQLPFPSKLNNTGVRNNILNTIDPKKDIDGLGTSAQFTPAAVKAVLYAAREAQSKKCLPSDLRKVTACVVGSSGMVGRPLVRVLREMGVKVVKSDVKTKNLSVKTLKSDLVISATGTPDLIRGNMVKPGSVVIDVGAPKGEVEFASVSKIASFITPVPGGIGPVTVISLMESVVEAAEKFRT